MLIAPYKVSTQFQLLNESSSVIGEMWGLVGIIARALPDTLGDFQGVM